MKNKTTRLWRMLSDIRRAQRCTALRAAAAAADVDALLTERDDDPPDADDATQDDASSAKRARTDLRH
ncbi:MULTISPECIES: hypothetical protein [Burkholderia]|uniref:Uncharacterized protein n=1 Tax=Burkholderia savannae TaxID=1637837 RepID=A0ABR5T7N8_9BURK|nr:MULTISPECIES: hypothetical protein [Burkholderia]AOJ72427.1 hypothetical protein WS78_27345 [Burkholderia savannae]AOJ82932.1 hypothetical protein WS86_19565 [Burkholderia savannae]AOK50821.1 hypothetical protein WT60_29135 [Burkholderia sp. MSMB617WGS]KVG46245.1 hypothetical protein WS77_31345 [Burkholderia sp. MSMB0265]KVG89607.1 hypothetical protein WS81_21445 [Burkholderia sp. MSMB2040]